MDRLLFISNGHGEDSIAVKVISRMRELAPSEPVIHAWPMVGEGLAYRRSGIPVIGPPNLLPSCGFATLSTRLMLKDLKAGWLSTHCRQFLASRSLVGRYSLVVAVGDIVVIGAAVLSKSPFYLIGCAKSSYYSLHSGYTRLEKYLLRRFCLLTFPRDELTVGELDRAAVPNAYLGNPMMDDLEDSEKPWDITPGSTVIGLLPGSRSDAESNALFLLSVAASLGCGRDVPETVCLFAAHENFDLGKMCDLLDEPRLGGEEWKKREKDHFSGEGVLLELIHEGGGIRALFVKGRFADVLRRSAVIVGTAGTANEQAVGLGKPLITFPTKGIMGQRYVRMKMKFFGPSAMMIPPIAGKIASAVHELLDDPSRRESMGKAGRERMGLPGASRRIAEEILRSLGAAGEADPGDERTL
jgi:uncharacterized protein (TIGR03492 family)